MSIIKSGRTATAILIFLFIISSLKGFTQTGTIAGRVTDEHGETLPGATISFGGEMGTVADRHGLFRFEVPIGQVTLNTSFVGYSTNSTTTEVKEGQVTQSTIILESASLKLRDVIITTENEDIINRISNLDIRLRPVKSSQELLRFVPGLFIAQHAGGGKAEQIFLRGFDIDHGTDIAISVDGMPVNMVSHAHGQGYSDLHFLIPETVRRIDFNTGPYYTMQGNFNTAGYVNFKTMDNLSRNMVKLEGGLFNTLRTVALINILPATTKTNWYVAAENYLTDGYFDSEQNFVRLNVFSKFRKRLNDTDQLNISASAFHSSWDASGQVPVRAVESGQISRFGAIDDTEGGITSRSNVNVEFARALSPFSHFSHQLYLNRYDFQLFSNFTFFLNDPENGDQIMQEEGRNLAGYNFNATFDREGNVFNSTTRVTGGFRYDDINDIGLYRTINRDQITETLAKGNIDELSVFGGLEQRMEAGKFVLTGGVRLDLLQQWYVQQQVGENTNPESGSMRVSPKIRMDYQFSPAFQVFVKAGSGFHSNDTRALLADPDISPMPRASGMDIGFTLKPAPKLVLTATGWVLDLEQEFVYVGDEALVEISGTTRRMGVDLAARLQFTRWLHVDANLNITRPRSRNAPDGENYIPLAPSVSSMGGLNAQLKSGFQASLRYRYLGDRPANEDYSLTADGFLLLDATLQYSCKKFDFTLTCENLLNTAWREAQFETESRLYNEPESVSEIHFTPGTPMSLRAAVAFCF